MFEDPWKAVGTNNLVLNNGYIFLFFPCLLQVATQVAWALYKSTFTSTFPYIVAIQLVGLIREWRYHSLEIDHFFFFNFVYRLV